MHNVTDHLPKYLKRHQNSAYMDAKRFYELFSSKPPSISNTEGLPGLNQVSEKLNSVALETLLGPA